MKEIENELMSFNEENKNEMTVVTKGNISGIDAFNMLNGQDERITSGTEIEAVACLFHPCTLEDVETGEIKEHIRTVIRSSDGTIYGSVSHNIFRQMKNLVNMFGDLSDKEPIKIRFDEKSFKGKDGKMRRTYQLKVVG